MQPAFLVLCQRKDDINGGSSSSREFKKALHLACLHVAAQKGLCCLAFSLMGGKGAFVEDADMPASAAALEASHSI
jgi:hypothetical protein